MSAALVSNRIDIDASEVQAIRREELIRLAFSASALDARWLRFLDHILFSTTLTAVQAARCFRAAAQDHIRGLRHNG